MSRGRSTVQAKTRPNSRFRLATREAVRHWKSRHTSLKRRPAFFAFDNLPIVFETTPRRSDGSQSCNFCKRLRSNDVASNSRCFSVALDQVCQLVETSNRFDFDHDANRFWNHREGLRQRQKLMTSIQFNGGEQRVNGSGKQRVGESRYVRDVCRE